jgi:hypothetical protein
VQVRVLMPDHDGHMGVIRLLPFAAAGDERRLEEPFVALGVSDRV